MLLCSTRRFPLNDSVYFIQFCSRLISIIVRVTSVQSKIDDAPHLLTSHLILYTCTHTDILLGLDQPGFVTSSNFLLPWEVVIKGIVKDQAPWPHVGEPTTHKQRKKMSAKRRKCCCTPS